MTVFQIFCGNRRDSLAGIIPYNISNIRRPSISVDAGCEESRVNKVEIV